MSTDSQNSERAERIAAAVERESVRRRRMLLLSLVLLAVPIAIAVYFGVYGHRDRELVNSAVAEKVEPIAAGIVAEEMNTQVKPLIQTEVAAKIEPLTADIRRLGDLKNDVAVLVQADKGLRQSIAGVEDQIEQKNSEKLKQVEQTLTLAQNTLADNLRREMNAIGTSVNVAFNEKFTELNERIGQIDSNPNPGAIADDVQVLKDKVRALENDKTALRRQLDALRERLTANSQDGRMRILGDAVWQVIGGRTTSIQVQFNRSVPRDTALNLELRDARASFVQDGRSTQVLQQAVAGEAVTVMIKADRVREPVMVNIAVQISDQPKERAWLRISPR